MLNNNANGVLLRASIQCAANTSSVSGTTAAHHATTPCR